MYLGEWVIKKKFASASLTYVKLEHKSQITL